MDNLTVTRALLSVTDKTGIVEFARSLSEEFGVEIVSTGGTARAIEEAGVEVRAIDDLTGFPEMMDGRVKTLHPMVHGGLLARRSNPGHMDDASAHGIGMIDLVAVNLYEFEKTVENPQVDYADAIEHIDIGGPSMLRSAAKNHESVTVVTNPSMYNAILEEMRAHGGATTYETRQKLALEVFKVTSAYDNAIYQWMANALEGQEYPDATRLFLEKQQGLRYGENPHQSAAFYRLPTATAHSLAKAKQLQGKELSYNNLLDTDACWSAVRDLAIPGCVILKHQNPCGAAEDDAVDAAYQAAFECDPTSAFGGIVACNDTVTSQLVQRVIDNGHYIEVLIAPDFEQEALDLLGQHKENCRVLQTGGIDPLGEELEYRSVDGGLLIQQRDEVSEDPATFTVPTKRQPSQEEMENLLFGWRIVKSVKSNAISLAKDKRHVGMGAGQPNRVNSARIAIEQAGDLAKGSVAASDAFFPFRDGIDHLAAAGVTAIIQPGGSMRDDECIQACDEHGIAMVFTGHRHFRH